MEKLVVKKKLIRELSRNKGFGLIEVIVAMVIISSIVAGYFNFNAQSVKNSQYINLKFKTLLMASNLAHESVVFEIRESKNDIAEGINYNQTIIKNGQKSYEVVSVVKIKNVSNKIKTYIYDK